MFLNLRFLISLVILIKSLVNVNVAFASLAVVASIKPIYNITAAIMEPYQPTALLISANTSPHDFALKPHDIMRLAKAELIIWVGSGLEGTLSQALQRKELQAQQLELMQLQGLKLLPQQYHNHDYHDHADDDNIYDPHIWLDPDNVAIIAQAICSKLVLLDPSNMALYQQNTQKFLQAIKQLDNKIKYKFNAALHGKKFILYHDGLQYFENKYNIKNSGIIEEQHGVPLSAKRVYALKKLIAREKIKCIFTEVQADKTNLLALLGSEVKYGMLDPLGSDSDLGPQGYYIMMEQLSDNFIRAMQG